MTQIHCSATAVGDPDVLHRHVPGLRRDPDRHRSGRRATCGSTSGRATRRSSEYIEAQRAVEGSGGYVRGYFKWLGQFVTGDWPRTIKGSREVWPDAAGRAGQLDPPRRHRHRSSASRVGLSIGIFAALQPGQPPRHHRQHGSVLRALDPAVRVGRDLPAVFAVYWSAAGTAEPFLPTSGVYPPGHRGFDLVVDGQTHDPARDRRGDPGDRRLHAVHAGLAARGLEQRLHAHRPLEGHQRAAGARPARIRNALIPVVTVAAIDIGGDPRRSDHHRGHLQLPGHGRVLPRCLHRRRLPAADAVDGHHRDRRDPVQPVRGRPRTPSSIRGSALTEVALLHRQTCDAYDRRDSSPTTPRV